MNDILKQRETDLSAAKTGWPRITALLNLANELKRSDPHRSIELAEEAEHLICESIETSDSNSQAQETLRSALARSLYERGVSYNYLTEYESAEELLSRALQEFESLSDTDNITQCLNNLGMTCKNKGEYPRAMEYYHKSLARSRGAANRRAEAAALLNIGNVFSHLGDLARALEYYQDSLNINEMIGNRRSEAFLLSNIGLVYSEIGDHHKALEFFRDSLRIKEKMNDGLGQADTYINIADSYLTVQEPDQAHHHARKSLEIAQDIGSKSTRVHALYIIGSVLAQRNKYEEALQRFHEALNVSREANFTKGQILILLSIGKLLQRQGETEQAIDILKECLSMAQKLQAKPDELKIHLAISDALTSIGKVAEAFEHFRHYHSIEREVLSEETTKKTIALQTWHASEQALKEAEIYRLKNVELAEANKQLQTLNHEKNEFLGIAAHDLKNQLSVIILSAGLLQRHTTSMSDSDRLQQMRRIETTAEHMREIILKLLDVNKLEAGQFELMLASFDIITLCESVIYTFLERATAKRIRLIHARHDEALYVYADSEKLQVVLENLISNAVKFSPSDSTVTLRARYKEHTVRIEVEDEGPGLTDDDRRRIFGKFARLSAKPTGGEHSTGLGLSIVKRLLDLMHGKIWCVSEKGKGAVFVIELPRG